MSQIISLSNVRLSFPHLVEAQANRNDPSKAPSYNADFILPESHPDFIKFMQTYVTLAQEKFKDHTQSVMQMIQGDRKSRCYGNGSEKVNTKTFQVYAGYQGSGFISAKSNNKPQIMDSTGKPIDSNNTMLYREMASKLYAGCRVNAALEVWIQLANSAKGYGNGVRSNLIAIQFAGDDEPLGKAEADVTGFFSAVATAPTAAAPAMGLPPFMMAN
jgi:hypothetical protein